MSNPRPRFPRKPRARRVPVEFIDSRKKALQFLDEAAQQKYVAIDTEFEPDTKEVSVWSYSWGRDIRRVVTGDLLTTVFADWLEDRRIRKVYANYKADGYAFAERGIDTDRSFHADIWTMSWIRDPNDVKHGLKHQGLKYLKWRRKEYSDTFCYIPEGKKKPIVMTPKQVLHALPDEALGVMSKEEWLQAMLDYSSDDAEETIVLYDDHKRYLQRVNYWEVFLKEKRRFTLTLMNCERRGIAIDQERLMRILREVEIRELQSVHVFRALADKPTLNLRSLPQLKALLIDELDWPVRDDLLTEKGEPQLNGDAFHWWAYTKNFELAKAMLNFKDISTLKGTFLEGLLSGIDDDGRLRSDFNQHGADTGRVSSRKKDATVQQSKTLKSGRVKTWTKKVKVGMNLQNIPSKKEKDPFGIRKAFIARYGYKLIVADYSGFELLMAIHWASKWVPDSKMLKVMKKYGSPSAVHAITCIEMFGKKCTWDNWHEVKKKWPDEYLYSKNCNFNLLYGGSAEMLCRIFGWDTHKKPQLVDKAQGLIDDWNDLYPEMGIYQSRMISHGHKHGWVPIIDGRRAPMAEGLSSDDYKTKAYWERKCLNTPCQGSAAAIMEVAMNLIDEDEELNGMYYELLFPVHDEVVGESPIEVAKPALDRVCYLMQQPYKEKFAFPLAVEGGIGDEWAGAKA